MENAKITKAGLSDWLRSIDWNGVRSSMREMAKDGGIELLDVGLVLLSISGLMALAQLISFEILEFAKAEISSLGLNLNEMATRAIIAGITTVYAALCIGTAALKTRTARGKHWKGFRAATFIPALAFAAIAIPGIAIAIIAVFTAAMDKGIAAPAITAAIISAACWATYTILTDPAMEKSGQRNTGGARQLDGAG